MFLEDKLQSIAAILEKRLSKNKVAGKTITLKIKYSDFKQLTRSKTGSLYLSSKALIFEQAKELLYQEKLLNSVRLIGISISNLNTLKKKQEVKPLKGASQLCLPF